MHMYACRYVDGGFVRPGRNGTLRIDGVVVRGVESNVLLRGIQCPVAWC